MREVHDDTVERAWAGLRTFLRPYRGVSKSYMDLYVAIFPWSYNVKAITAVYIRALCGLWPPTRSGS